jgi:hypothetical protein
MGNNMKSLQGYLICIVLLISTIVNVSVHAVTTADGVPNFEKHKFAGVQVLDPKDALSFLREDTVKGKPQLFISRFDANQGLLVGYQADSGKRILFRSRSFLGAGVSGQVLHYDKNVNKIAQIIGRSKNVGADGKRIRDVSVNGIDLRDVTKRNRKLKLAERDAAYHRLKEFAHGEVGTAFIDAVPVLYAVLESIDPSEDAAKLLAPFGSTVLLLQLSSERFPDVGSISKILGDERSALQRQTCGYDQSCAMRGNRFTLHRHGLFDPISKNFGGASIGKKSNIERPFLLGEASEQTLLQAGRISSISQLWRSTIQHKSGDTDGNGQCSNITMNGQYFGGCGPSTLTPGNIWTIQCRGHDYCVCAYSHLDCVNEVPLGCGVAQGVTCYSLWAAAESWFGEIWDMIGDWWTDFWEWVEGWFEDEEQNTCPPGIICQS